MRSPGPRTTRYVELPGTSLITPGRSKTRATDSKDRPPILEQVSVRWLTAFIDMPHETFERGVLFWREVTDSTLSPPRGELQQFATFLPSSGDPYIRVQRIDEGSAGCHLDVHCENVEESFTTATELGARVLARNAGFFRMRSPVASTFVSWPIAASTSDHPRSRVKEPAASLIKSALTYRLSISHARWNFGPCSRRGLRDLAHEMSSSFSNGPLTCHFESCSKNSSPKKAGVGLIWISLVMTLNVN